MRVLLTKNAEIVVFLVITAALTTAIQIPVLRSGSIRAVGGGVILAAMWSPGLAAMATRLLFHRNLRGFGWGWGKTRYQLLSYGLPLLIISTVYAVVWSTSLGQLSLEGYAERVSGEFGLEEPLSLGLSVAIIATLGLVANSVAALGEELGWRGFLVPELARTNSFARTALISGLIWAIWHYPIIIWADYSGNVATWCALPSATVMFVGMSTIMAWIRLKSGSVWTAVIFHAAHNLFIQAIFGQMTAEGETTDYFASEFGVLTALAYGGTALFVWRRLSGGRDPRV